MENVLIKEDASKQDRLSSLQELKYVTDLMGEFHTWYAELQEQLLVAFKDMTNVSDIVKGSIAGAVTSKFGNSPQFEKLKRAAEI